MRSLISILDFSVEEVDQLLDTAKDIIAHPEQYWDKLELGSDAMDTSGNLIFLQAISIDTIHFFLLK